MKSRSTYPVTKELCQLAGNLVPKFMASCLICGALFLVLTKFGQVSDLLRAVNDNLMLHLFLTMAFAQLTCFCLALCLDGLSTLQPESMPAWGHMLIRLLAGVSAPTLLAIKAFGAGEEVTVGFLLGFSGVLAPIYAVLQMWLSRGSLSLEKTSRTITWSFALVAVLYYLALFWKPVSVGLLTGSVAIFFICSVAVLWVIWFLATRTPVVLFFLVIPLVVLANYGSYGVREVRKLTDGEIRRPTAAEHARGWLEARRSEMKKEGVYPVFFVTSDGGGIRSSYWTTALLGSLSDDDETFPQHIYLLSGVSGGSVGAALFAAQVADTQQVASRGGFRASTNALLSKDFLAAPLAQMLTRDLPESVFCQGLSWKWACSEPLLDRIVALETVFEGAWTMAVGTHRFEERMERLWDGDLQWRVPALILNSTNAHTGEKRVISSFSDKQAWGSDQDVLGRMPVGETLRLSTAAMLSARFPVISPEGEITLSGVPEHLVDGGYFDNSGGESALAVLPEFLKAVRAAKMEGVVLPIAIVIKNDPERRSLVFNPQACTPPKVDDLSLKHNIGGLLTEPIGTLDAERSYSAELRRTNWESAIKNANGVVLELPLFRCLEDKDFEFPLGWTLSKAAREHIDLKVERLKNEAGSPFRQILESLPHQHH